LDLGPLAALVAGSALLICPDGDLAVLGEALGIPRVVLHREDRSARWLGRQSPRQRDILWLSAAPARAILREADDLLASVRALARTG
jgi:hypothetical protein